MDRIRVVDFETDGTEPPARVIEVGWCDVGHPVAGGTVIHDPVSRLCGGGKITAETRAVHHISPKDIDGREPFFAAPFVHEAREDRVTALAAHHADFEGKWLGPVLGEMPLICTYKAALRVWPEAPEHKNQVLRYWLVEQGLTAPDDALCQPAHRAGPDAYATAWLLKALLERATVADMIAWTAEPAVTPRCPIGKWRGRRWSEVDAGFLGWMLRQADMDAGLKFNARRELARRGSDGPIT